VRANRRLLGSALVCTAALAGATGCKSARDVRIEQQPVAAERLHEARAEIRALPDHPWAGEYRTRTDLVGDRVVLAPTAGVVSDPWSDLPIAGSMNYGHILRVDEDLIAVELAFPTGSRRRGPCRADLVRITWGERRYLVWRDRLEQLQDELRYPIGADGEFSRAMLHEADRTKPAGTPEQLIAAVERAVAIDGTW